MGECWQWEKAKALIDDVEVGYEPSDEALNHLICLLQLMKLEKEEETYPAKG